MVYITLAVDRTINCEMSRSLDDVKLLLFQGDIIVAGCLEYNM